MIAAAGVADARVPGYLGRVLDGGGAPVGTCFQVAPGVLVTAWHVLEDIGAAAGDARVRIDPLAGGEPFDAAVARMDSLRDLAVLTSVAGLPAVAGPLWATDHVPLRVQVMVTGHAVPDDPGHKYRFLNAPGEWAGGTTRDEVLLGRMTSSAVVPGMSGGPVICDSDGAVAGVVSGRYNSVDGWLAGTVWVARTEDLAVLLDGIAEVAVEYRPLAGPVAGRPLDEVRDPFALEVHRPIQPEDPQPGLPVLPAYVPRDHDTELGSVMRTAADGSSQIAVLVGGSSTGKTRACWEALDLLRDRPGPWRLWHPIDPSRPDAALAELPGIGPRTVVWLNEAQFYLDTADERGERVAARLRELLRDAGRGPVLVLATVWPEYWDVLTARPASGDDRHAQARELLSGHDITVPAKFTPAQLSQLTQAADARLVLAARSAQDGQVIQYLAGAPELLARYRNAPPAAAALICAAMDARRLGTGPDLPRAFLEAAAPGYLADAEWDALSEDWLERALAYTAKPCKGVRGPLARIRPRPTRSRTPGPGSRDSDEQLAGGPASTPRGPLYRLADYLDQHGRVHRKGEIPPAGFWAAAADHAFPSDQAALGDAAHDRGLYRAAAQLHKNAARHGNLQAVTYLAAPPNPDFRTLLRSRADVRPLGWIAAQAPLDNPRRVAWLLGALRKAGAQEQVTALLRRDPAAHVSLDDPGAMARPFERYAVTDLLRALRKAGAQEQVSALAVRAAGHAPLENLRDVADLLRALRKAGAGEQVTALAGRAAAHAPLKISGGMARLFKRYDVTDLLAALRAAGAGEQAAALAGRAAAHAPLDDPGAVARLLGALRAAGAQEQVTVLLRRDPAAHVSLDDPGAVARLLGALRAAGAQEQVTVLLRRDPAAHATLENLRAVARLGALPKVGAGEQATAPTFRPGPAFLKNPYDLTDLLDSLQRAGAAEQATALADRVAAHAPLDDPRRVIRLLDSLQRAGAGEQATALAARAAAHVSLDDPFAVADLLDRLRVAGAGEQATVLAGRAAAHASLDDPGRVARLLGTLRAAGAQEQVTALADRVAAHAPLENPGAIGRLYKLSATTTLLGALRAAGAGEQATALAGRAAAHVSLDDPGAVADLLRALRKAGAGEQVTALLRRDPAAHATLENLRAVADLLRALRKAGAGEQATALAGRAAAHAPLKILGAVARLFKRYDVTDLLATLRKAGAGEQAAALAGRAAAHAPLEDPFAVARLLGALRKAGAQEQVTALAGRAAAHAPLDDPGQVAWLLGALRAAGAQEQVTALAGRAAAHAPLDDPGAVARLLGALRAAGAQEQAAALASRLAGAGMFELLRQQGDRQDQFRFGREADGSPAKPWDWGDLD